jgi:hypothetical protein
MKFTVCGCGNQVSHDSKRCPKCGGKVKHPISPVAGLLTAFCVVLLCVILFALSTTKPSADYGPPSESSAPVDPHWDVTFAVSDFEPKIKENLKDPDSYQQIGAFGNATAVCVEFRSKNSFGGYGEPARAVLLRKTNVYYMSESSDGPSFRRAWAQCK